MLAMTEGVQMNHLRMPFPILPFFFPPTVAGASAPMSGVRFSRNRASSYVFARPLESRNIRLSALPNWRHLIRTPVLLPSLDEAACSYWHVLISTNFLVALSYFLRLTEWIISGDNTSRLYTFSRRRGLFPYPKLVTSMPNYPHILCLSSSMFHLVPQVSVLAVLPAVVFSEYDIFCFFRSAFLVCDCFLLGKFWPSALAEVKLYLGFLKRVLVLCYFKGQWGRISVWEQ